MESPLSDRCKALEGKKVEDMSVSELKLWIEACNKMGDLNEGGGRTIKERVSSRAKAEHELKKRLLNQKKTIADLLEEEEIPYQHLNAGELEELEKSWKQRFNANDLRNAGGQLWHAFSFNNYADYKEGEQADQRYLNQQVREFLIWGADKGYRCFSDKLPDLLKLKRLTRDFDVTYDLYVCHKNLKWTYVYTHEDFCGPYFAE